MRRERIVHQVSGDIRTGRGEDDRLVRMHTVTLVGGPCNGERAEIQEDYLEMWRFKGAHYYLYTRRDTDEEKMYWHNERKSRAELVEFIKQQTDRAFRLGADAEIVMHADPDDLGR